MTLQPQATALDAALARLVATREGVSVVVYGGIAKQGTGYRLSVTAIDARSGETLVAQTHDSAGKEEVLGAVGRLAAPIRAKLGDSTPESVQVTAAETFTPANLEAAHAYAVGTAFLPGDAENVAKSRARIPAAGAVHPDARVMHGQASVEASDPVSGAG